MAGNSKTVVVICGPTAVGKTAAAIALAQALNTEIISADSRQCYRELSIGVARPSPDELAAVPHHFIATHSIHDKVTAAVFEDYALRKVHDLFRDNDRVVMVGGTGLYLKALYEGMDPIPEVPETVHQQLINAYEEKGLVWLQQQVQEKDPDFAASGEMKNPQRMLRALEVITATGRSITSFRTGIKKQRDFRILKFGLTLPREQLHRNIETRVDAMMQQGLLEEVRSLLPYAHLPALQTVGYQELFAHLSGMLSLEEAVSVIKKNTRQYAKRQMTWFRKDSGVNWIGADSTSLVEQLVAQSKSNQVR